MGDIFAFGGGGRMRGVRVWNACSLSRVFSMASATTGVYREGSTASSAAHDRLQIFVHYREHGLEALSSAPAGVSVDLRKPPQTWQSGGKPDRWHGRRSEKH